MSELSSAITGGIESVTKKWAKQRKAEERSASAAMNRRQAMTSCREITIKEIAYEVMEAAYLKASAGGTLPANARQVMYAARPQILTQTGKDRMDDSYFTQSLLPDYIAEHGLEDQWDIAYDPRGHLTEPHSGRLCGPTGMDVVSLGTLEVRDYIAARPDDPLEIHHLPVDFPTAGPEHRYSSVLFIEKEGFTQLLNQARLAAKYDLAIMSTKGMSNVASRALIDDLAGRGVRVFVARDFDQSGFSIAATLTRGSRRYQFHNWVDVVDFGIRLADVDAYDLPAEPVHHRANSRWTVQGNLRRNGATPEEIEFLLGQRVELNAFTSDQFITWLEDKLDAHGVEKVIPDPDTLALQFRRSLARHAVNEMIDEIRVSARDTAALAAIPDDLTAQVRQLLDDDSAMSWDGAVTQIAGGVA